MLETGSRILNISIGQQRNDRKRGNGTTSLATSKTKLPRFAVGRSSTVSGFIQHNCERCKPKAAPIVVRSGDGAQPDYFNGDTCGPQHCNECINIL